MYIKIDMQIFGLSVTSPHRFPVLLLYIICCTCYNLAMSFLFKNNCYRRAPLLAHHHPLQPCHVTLFSCNLKVSVDDATCNVNYICCRALGGESTHVTANKIPVPEPRAPIRSLITLKPPMQAPPKAAAVGMTLLSSRYMLCSLCPAMTKPCSRSCFATSRGADPETSIQVLLNTAQATSMKIT